MKEDNSTSNLLKWFENDDLFFRECREGQRWQEYVGRYLNTKGVKVHVEELSFRGNPNVSRYSDDEASRWSLARKKMKIARKEYVNTKDILVLPSAVLEVKSRNLRFTSPKDFPFDTVFIDTVSGYEQKKPKPRLYISVSRKTGCIIATSGVNSGKWSKRKIYDKVRNIWEINYECAIENWLHIDDYIPAMKRYQEVLAK
jgi:hypothetical protein